MQGLAGLAVDVGYADHAHLSRECARLTGLSPSELLGGSFDRCACGHDHTASYMPFLATRAVPPLAHLVVEDIAAARDELVSRGVQVGEIRHIDDGQWKDGLDPGRNSYMSFAEFCDPDANLWVLQEVHSAR